MSEGIFNILLVIVLLFATRGIFALWNDLKKVVWIERMTDKEEVKETLRRR